MRWGTSGVAYRIAFLTREHQKYGSNIVRNDEESVYRGMGESSAVIAREMHLSES